MRRIREVLRLRAELGANLSAIAVGAGLARSTVRGYLARAAAAGLDGGAAERLSDTALEAALFPPPALAAGRAVPDWAAIDQELRRHKHVTRKLLWLEYKAEHPDGFAFSQFKSRLSEWQKASGRGLSRRSSARRSNRCRPSPTCLASGRSPPPSASTTTSPSSGISTPCRMHSPANASTSSSRGPPCRSFTAASGWPAMPGWPGIIAGRRWVSICRRRTVLWPTARRGERPARR